MVPFLRAVKGHGKNRREQNCAGSLIHRSAPDRAGLVRAAPIAGDGISGCSASPAAAPRRAAASPKSEFLCYAFSMRINDIPGGKPPHCSSTLMRIWCLVILSPPHLKQNQ